MNSTSPRWISQVGVLDQHQERFLDSLEQRLSSLISQKHLQFRSECQLSELRILNETARHYELSEEFRRIENDLSRLLQQQQQLQETVASLSEQLSRRREFNSTTLQYNSFNIGEKGVELQRVSTEMARQVESLKRSLQRETRQQSQLRQKQDFLKATVAQQLRQLSSLDQKRKTVPHEQDLEQTRKAQPSKWE